MEGRGLRMSEVVGYRQEWKRNRMHFSGSSKETWGRDFSVHEESPGKYQVSWLSSRDGRTPRKRFKAASLNELIRKSEAYWYGPILKWNRNAAALKWIEERAEAIQLNETVEYFLSNEHREQERSYLYMMTEDGTETPTLKIGISRDPERRVSSVNQKPPTFSLAVILENPAAREVEKMLHSLLAPARIHGEYFEHRDPACVAYLIAIAVKVGMLLGGEALPEFYDLIGQTQATYWGVVEEGMETIMEEWGLI